jgi:hypothetical protein
MRTPTLAGLLLLCVGCQRGAQDESGEAPAKEPPELDETVPETEDEGGPGPRLLTPVEFDALFFEDDTEEDEEEDEGEAEEGWDTVVESQREMDALCLDTDAVDELTISCVDCVDLSGLHCLTEVRGSLEIRNNPLLESLEGMDLLESIASTERGTLAISGNPALERIGSLGAPARVGELYSLLITDNPLLASVDGLQLDTLDGTSPYLWVLSVSGNAQLQSLDGLVSADELTASQLYLTDNAMLGG